VGRGVADGLGDGWCFPEPVLDATATDGDSAASDTHAVVNANAAPSTIPR
jgi:hypothetical protein